MQPLVSVPCARMSAHRLSWSPTMHQHSEPTTDPDERVQMAVYLCELPFLRNQQARTWQNLLNSNRLLCNIN